MNDESSSAGTMVRPKDTESIWLGAAPSSYADVEYLVGDLWPLHVGGREKGAGGRTLQLHGAGSEFSTAPLQKFANALAGHLRYQTVEIFLSRPVLKGDRSTPVLVAAAFRQDAEKFGRFSSRVSSDGRERHPYRWKGVSDLSDSRLSPLRRLLLSGETARTVLERMRAYVRQAPSDIDLVEFVDYAAAATAIATLAGPCPSDVEGSGPPLWEIVRESLSIGCPRGTNGLHRNSVRNALYCMTRAYGNLLLEADADPGRVIQDAMGLVSTQRMPRLGNPRGDDFDVTAELWLRVSSGISRIASRLRDAVASENLPTSVIRFLFEAPVRSYPEWLRSATLAVEKEQDHILHGALHEQVYAARGGRNKPVNVLTLEAYEKAAGALLIGTDSEGRSVPTLHSMLLFPFRVKSRQQLTSDGFVRFMNRFVGQGDNRAPYPYRREAGVWKPTLEEVEMGLATTALLHDKVQELGLLSGHVAPKDNEQQVDEEGVSATPVVASADHNRSDRGVDVLSSYLDGGGWKTPKRWREKGFIGFGPRMNEVYEDLDAFSGDGDLSVLVSGEMGTGKELVARAIHTMCGSARDPFVPLDCGSLEANLSGSELFGHAKGAFTGAIHERVGAFVRADGGTIFLDEIGNLSPENQAKLLRVLQEREVRPIGSDRTVRVNLQVVSATNTKLEEAVAAESFRSDLYYRIGGRTTEILVPPLRERMEELVELIGWFLLRQKREGRSVSLPTKDCVEALCRYDWPGNIRELENTLRSAVARARGSAVGIEHLPRSLKRSLSDDR